MSYPYLSDLANHLLGTQWNIPIAMFGSFVAIAIVVATWVAKSEVMRFEGLGLLPRIKSIPNGYTSAHQILPDLAMVAAIAGIIGARIFHILEYPSEFLLNPLSMIFSGSGLSIYGGLIFGGIAGALFLRRHAVPLVPMLDALAPALILGYGIGRIGCQISGDGDWGIAANMSAKPDLIPSWLWAQTYENNVVGTIIELPGVYPTPIYEALGAFFIFSILWAVRKSNYNKGFMFSAYLLLSGFERLLIEKIRVNSEYQLLGAAFTQAEFISTLFILGGLVGILNSTKFPSAPKVVISVAILGALTACSKL